MEQEQSKLGTRNPDLGGQSAKWALITFRISKKLAAQQFPGTDNRRRKERQREVDVDACFSPICYHERSAHYISFRVPAHLPDESPTIQDICISATNEEKLRESLNRTGALSLWLASPQTQSSVIDKKMIEHYAA